jgi:TPR repeat protein
MPVCARVASTWCDFDGEGLGACKREGVERYRKACDAGIAFACFGLSGVYKRGGDGVTADAQQAAKLEATSKKLFAEACDKGSVQDCLMVSSDKTTALATAACDAGDALGCLAMADEDIEHRVAWYGKACKLGFADACQAMNDVE